MKSQMIKTKNLKNIGMITHSLSVKPKGLLLVVAILGIIALFSTPFIAAIGICCITTSVFCLVLMPDRKLMQTTDEYLILYTDHNSVSCMLIAWDEIVHWQYEWHRTVDKLIITLVDGSSYSIDTFSKRSTLKLLKDYAGIKELKNVRVK